MKLIIDIPEDYYEIIKHHVDNHQLDYRPFEIIANGIPLDDVKAEIDDLDVSDLGKMGIITAIFEILDKHIGKAESEE